MGTGVLRQGSHLIQSAGGDAGRADDRVDAVGDAPSHVVHHGGRCGEVDGHVHRGLPQRIEGPCHLHVTDHDTGVTRIDRRRQDEPGMGGDGPAELPTHSSRRAEDPDADHRIASWNAFGPNGPSTVSVIG